MYKPLRQTILELTSAILFVITNFDSNVTNSVLFEYLILVVSDVSLSFSVNKFACITYIIFVSESIEFTILIELNL